MDILGTRSDSYDVPVGASGWMLAYNGREMSGPGAQCQWRAFVASASVAGPLGSSCPLVL